jgi:hypothetical protein
MPNKDGGDFIIVVEHIHKTFAKDVMSGPWSILRPRSNVAKWWW